MRRVLRFYQGGARVGSAKRKKAPTLLALTPNVVPTKSATELSVRVMSRQLRMDHYRLLKAASGRETQCDGVSRVAYLMPDQHGTAVRTARKARGRDVIRRPLKWCLYHPRNRGYWSLYRWKITCWASGRQQTASPLSALEFAGAIDRQDGVAAALGEWRSQYDVAAQAMRVWRASGMLCWGRGLGLRPRSLAGHLPNVGTPRPPWILACGVLPRSERDLNLNPCSRGKYWIHRLPSGFAQWQGSAIGAEFDWGGLRHGKVRT